MSELAGSGTILIAGENQGQPPHAAERQRNSFDYLRLLLAALVLVSHTPELKDGTRSREILTRIFGTLSFGELAVDGFFILSGYLITQSWQREPKFRAFLLKRVRRIYPGFLAAALITGLIMAPFGTNPSVYFSEFRPQAFLIALPLLHHYVPNSFPGLPFGTVNGALWTIPFEFACYLMVAAVGVLGWLRSKRTARFVVCAFLLMTLHIIYRQLGEAYWETVRYAHIIARLDQLCRLSAYYLMGMAYCLSFAGKRLSPAMAWTLFVLLCIFLFHPITAEFALMTFGTALLFHVGLRTYPLLERLPLKADISYGTYLYGWTIQQFVHQRLPDAPLIVSFLLVLLLSLLAGTVSWHFIEKPFLKRKCGK